MSNPSEDKPEEFLEINVADIELPETAISDETAMENLMERRELLVNPSDLTDVGDPEAGDVGLAGGLGAGGEMGEGGYGVAPDDPWGLDLLQGEETAP